MDKIKRKSIFIAITVGLLYSLLPIFTMDSRKYLDERILTGITYGTIMGIIAFFVARVAIKSNIKFEKWWQWIFYVVGLVTGVTNILFWIIMAIAYSSYYKKGPFFNKNFHRRVYIWGGIVSIFIGIFLLLILWVFL